MAEITTPERKASQRPAERRGKSPTEIREAQKARSQRKKMRKRALITTGAVIFAVIFIAGLVATPGLTRNLQNRDTGVNEGGPVALDKDDGTAHVAPGEAHAAYSFKPATSGPHWQTAPSTLAPYGAPARWGEYEEALPDEVLIHNLEHGGIGLHYNCPEGCADVVDQLRSLLPSSKSQFILSPYPGMQSKIAVTGWRHHMLMDQVDREKILEFIREYQNRAPESVPGNMF